MSSFGKIIPKTNDKNIKDINYEWEVQVKRNNKWETSYQVLENQKSVPTLVRNAIGENPHSQIRLIRHKHAIFKNGNDKEYW